MMVSNNPLPSCLHGEWVGGLCLCDKEHTSAFDDALLHPVYCSERKTYVVSQSIDPMLLLHYLSMSVSTPIN